MDALTRKQARFVEEYAVDFNGTQAAVRAGYAPRSARVTASRLLTKVAIQEAVGALQRHSAEQLRITRERILEELQTAIQIAKVQGDVQSMIRGWVEVARICGYYAPERKSVEVSVSAKRVMRELERLSDAELLAIAENGASD